MASIHSRWAQQRGHRPVRIANCSGYKADPGYKMLEQASLGDVDFITGDYLAEVNIAENAEAMAAGTHPGYEFTAWDGIQQSIDVLNEKGIKVIVNGGAQNPKGLAERVCGLVRDKSYGLKVAWIEGDNLLKEAREMVKNGQLPPHLDSENAEVHLAKGVTRSPDSQKKPIVSANAYLGAREIVKALELGADIVIAGRVADASPVSTIESLQSRNLIEAGNRGRMVLAFLVRDGLRSISWRSRSWSFDRVLWLCDWFEFCRILRMATGLTIRYTIWHRRSCR